MATSQTPAQGSEEPSGPESGLQNDGSPPQEDGDGPALAEPGQRLLARIVDTLIVGLPVIIVVKEFVSGHQLDVVAPPAVAGCMLLYEAVQLAIWGRTLGKRFAGIEVVSAVPALPGREGAATGAEEAGTAPSAAGPPQAPYGRPSALRAVLRAAVYAVPIALRPVHILGLLAGVFWVANAGFIYEGTRRQALHDRLAGTLVVKRRTP
ncbi:RDD family protein [Actinomadura sp. NTSP31]|uniref:RDD family protein n=1 Tax=Actinomadura sp. NTSP31 TaxID=1735447 RepID=UPI0035C1D716